MLNWLKKYWWLVLIALFFGLSQTNFRSSAGQSSSSFSAPSALRKTANYSIDSVSQAPPVDTPNRLVIRDTSLSLQVKDVGSIITQIESSARSLGGYMVESSLSRPEFAASGSITVRVPEDKRADALTAFKNLAVKIVSENVFGTDITDQYTDLQTRLDILNQTKIKFEEIRVRATTVADLLTVQRELINLQTQIDNLKGQQKYYEQSAKLTKITAHLSTDDLSLPYASDQSWRPLVVFRQAVRSLIGHLRGLGSLVIWLVVYSPLLLLVIGLVYFFRRKISRR